MALDRVISGRYRIEELLGRGGMANVWRGRDLRLDRPVAIKEPAGPWLEDPTAMARFDREARTAARLAHPNIVAVYDVCINDKGRYLVMELVEGATVADMLSDGPLPVAAVIDVAVQTCDGLAAAHAAGIIHRDIKPANLIVTHAGVVKVCDFGIARALPATSDTSVTGPSYAMGSSKFMAPEQASGGPVDARSDLYALGCTIYAMLAGDAPFSGDASQLLHQHLKMPSTPLRELRPDVPPRLEALVSQLLAKTPDARPADALEVKTQLLAIDADPTTAASSDPAPAYIAASRIATAPPRPNRAGRLRWAAGGGFLALAAVVILVAAMSRSTPGGPPDSRARVVAPLGTATTSWMTTPAQPQATIQPSTSAQSTGPGQPGAAVPATTQAPSVDPIAALRLSIQQQVNTGHLNPDKASDLYKKVDEIARAMNASNTEEALKKIKEFRDKITGLLNDGQLSVGGHAILTQNLDSVAAAVA